LFGAHNPAIGTIPAPYGVTYYSGEGEVERRAVPASGIARPPQIGIFGDGRPLHDNQRARRERETAASASHLRGRGVALVIAACLGASAARISIRG